MTEHQDLAPEPGAPDSEENRLDRRSFVLKSGLALGAAAVAPLVGAAPSLGARSRVASRRCDVAEAKRGEEFIKHEFDEAIAIHEGIVQAEQQLAKSHPFPEARRNITALLKEDRTFAEQLRALGTPYGATGEIEEVAGSMLELMTTTLGSAGEAESEAYEAHAVLLSLKRKQQDSGAAMLRIARARKDPELRDAATEFERGQREGAKVLAASLAAFAVEIAQADARA